MLYAQSYHAEFLFYFRNVGYLFGAMFEIELTYGKIKLGDEFKLKVKRWLDNKDELVEQVYNQKVIKIFNRYYHDEMIYNSLRGKRPQTKQATSEKNYTMNVLEESLNECDFCESNYLKNTATETFGRIETQLSYTAANTFKYDKWHSLIVSRNHNSLFLSEEETIDLFTYIYFKA